MQVYDLWFIDFMSDWTYFIWCKDSLRPDHSGYFAYCKPFSLSRVAHKATLYVSQWATSDFSLFERRALKGTWHDQKGDMDKGKKCAHTMTISKAERNTLTTEDKKNLSTFLMTLPLFLSFSLTTKSLRAIYWLVTQFTITKKTIFRNIIAYIALREH